MAEETKALGYAGALFDRLCLSEQDSAPRVRGDTIDPLDV